MMWWFFAEKEVVNLQQNEATFNVVVVAVDVENVDSAFFSAFVENAKCVCLSVRVQQTRRYSTLMATLTAMTMTTAA